MNPKATIAWAVGLESLATQAIVGGFSVEYDGPYTADCDGECPGKKPTPPSPPQAVQQTIEHVLSTSPSADLVFASGSSSLIISWYTSFLGVTEENTYKIPFSPGFKNGFFDNQTVSLNATMQMQTDKTKVETYRLWDMRNLYGYMVAKATFEAHTNPEFDFINRQNRTFIASESTFSAASSAASAHFFGETPRTYEWMKSTISSMLSMNILGVPIVGSDVCGTSGKQDDMLCAYWYQLAVFYPLARNNYKVADGANEPYNVKDKTNALPMIKTAMQDRLKMLRYIYTTAFEAHLNGGTVVRPMYHEYPEDEDAWFNLDQDFMVGKHVKVSPVLAAGLKEYDSYFPAEKGEAWVNLFDLSDLQVAGDPKMHKRTMIKPSHHVNAYLRPGSIIPMQDLEYTGPDGKTKMMSMTTEDLMRKNKVNLVINPDKDQRATGTVLIDDGYSRDYLMNGMYDYYEFVMTNGVIRKQWKTNESGAGGYPDAKKGEPV